MYFNSFSIEYIPQEEVLRKSKDNSITHNIFRIPSDDSMPGFYCIAFIEFTIAWKGLVDYNILFFPNEYQKIYKYFKENFDKKQNKKKTVRFEFRLRKIGESRNYLLAEIKYYMLMAENNKKVCWTLNYIKNFLFVSAAT